MIRLKDIALKAGVSVMTVSKSLRDAPDLSPATKTRVKLLAQQMGYVPDSTAQSLRSRTTKIFGLVISAMTNPLFSRLVLGLEERAYELGYEIILAHSLNVPEREDAYIRRLLSRRVDGLFIWPVYRLAPTAPIFEELRKRGTPTVLLGPLAPFCRGFANVETDDLQASYQLTQHLLKLGHRDIAFLTGPAAAPWATERFEGYRKAFREAGMEVDDSKVFSAGATIEDGITAALQLCNEKVRVTAVQAVNDLVAIGAADTLLNQGIKIPGDVSFAGFGNILVSEYFRVPLTTIRQPKLRLGTAAMELMLKLLHGGQPETRRLPAEIIVRSSTAAPPKA